MGRPGSWPMWCNRKLISWRYCTKLRPDQVLSVFSMAAVQYSFIAKIQLFIAGWLRCIYRECGWSRQDGKEMQYRDSLLVFTNSTNLTRVQKTQRFFKTNRDSVQTCRCTKNKKKQGVKKKTATKSFLSAVGMSGPTEHVCQNGPFYFVYLHPLVLVGVGGDWEGGGGGGGCLYDSFTRKFLVREYKLQKI